MGLFNRKKKNRRKQKAAPSYQWLKSLAWFSVSASVLSMVAWGVVTLMSPQTLPLKHIRFSGELVNTTETDLRSVMHQESLGGFFSTDVTQIKTDIQSLPWVRRVQVRRVWPDTLAIKIFEQRAVAQWQESAFLNSYGELFTPATIEAGELVQFAGPEASQKKMLEDYRQMQVSLSDTGLKIKSISMNERRAYSLQLDNGVELALGREQSLLRLQRFASIYLSDLAATVSAIASIDMRYPNGFSVSWKEQKTISQGSPSLLQRGNHAKKS